MFSESELERMWQDIQRLHGSVDALEFRFVKMVLEKVSSGSPMRQPPPIAPYNPSLDRREPEWHEELANVPTLTPENELVGSRR